MNNVACCHRCQQKVRRRPSEMFINFNPRRNLFLITQWQAHYFGGKLIGWTKTHTKNKKYDIDAHTLISSKNSTMFANFIF